MGTEIIHDKIASLRCNAVVRLLSTTGRFRQAPAALCFINAVQVFVVVL